MENIKVTAKRSPKKRPSQGLGDTIAKVTKATGIEKLVKFALGEDCGCAERQEKLNKLFPYKRQPLCLNENEFFWWQNFKSQNATHLSKDMADQISAIWSRVFQSRKIYRPCTCNPREWSRMIEDIDKVYNTYEH